MPKNTCCIRGCIEGPKRNTQSTSDLPNENITHFQFPVDVAGQKKWLKNINILNRQELNLDSVKIPRKVCSRHFEQTFISEFAGRRFLSVFAVPTIFPLLNPDEGDVEILDSGGSDDEEAIVKVEDTINNPIDATRIVFEQVLLSIPAERKPVISTPTQPIAQTPSSVPALSLKRLALHDSEESSDEEFSVKDPNTIIKLEHIVNSNRIQMISLQRQVNLLNSAILDEQERHLQTKEKCKAQTMEIERLTAQNSALQLEMDKNKI